MTAPEEITAALLRKCPCPTGLIQFEVRYGPVQGPEHETQSFYGRADHRGFKGT
jgi:hypothetical protein